MEKNTILLKQTTQLGGRAVLEIECKVNLIGTTNFLQSYHTAFFFATITIKKSEKKMPKFGFPIIKDFDDEWTKKLLIGILIDDANPYLLLSRIIIYKNLHKKEFPSNIVDIPKNLVRTFSRSQFERALKNLAIYRFIDVLEPRTEYDKHVLISYRRIKININPFCED